MKTTLCHHHGCYSAAVPGKHFCQRHSAEERRWGKGFRNSARKKSQEWHELYNSERWRQMRREFLKRYPFCFICGRGATIADHIVPHRGDASLFYDMENLQPMCVKCHSAKTLRENNYFKGDGGEKP